ncbi:hypothetical protein F6R83_09845 [Citrobacter amalonaticus]|nr:hypothetical protein [Citrobacter amalonaticus]
MGLKNQYLVINGTLLAREAEHDALTAVIWQREQEELANLPAGLSKLPTDTLSPLQPVNMVGVTALKRPLDMGNTVRALLRKSVEPYEELGLAEDKFTDDQLIDFMLQHPILINRPIVVTPLGTKLCRPSEVVLDILPDAQKAAFTREDGEKVIDDAGKRLK